MTFRFILAVFLCFIACAESIQAQTPDAIEEVEDGIMVDSSAFAALPTKIDSFYTRFNINLKTCERPELYHEIFRWYRTCYRYGGGTAKGIDCSHFVNMLYDKIYGVKLNNSAASIYTQCKPVKGGKGEFVEGDLVFFKIKKKRISHVGIYLQQNKFAHATTKAGVIISDLNEPYYRKHFFKVGKLKQGLTDTSN